MKVIIIKSRVRWDGQEELENKTVGKDKWTTVGS